MTDVLGDHVVEAADRLLRTSAAAPEDNIRQNIARLFDALGIENIITYATDHGPADLYLPRRRVLIETKRVGRADDPDAADAATGESPRQQLERYLRSEIAAEGPPPRDAGNRVHPGRQERRYRTTR